MSLFSPFIGRGARTHAPRLMRWGFVAVMAVIVFVAAMSFWRVELGNKTLNEIVAHEQTAIELLYRMQFAARDRSFALFAAVHTDDPFLHDSAMRRFDEQGAAFGRAREALLRLPLTERERALLDLQREQARRTLSEQQRVLDLLQAGRRHEAEIVLVERAVPAQDKMILTLTALLDDAVARTKAHVEDLRRVQRRTGLLFVVLGLSGLLLTWGIFVSVSRRTENLITRLVGTTERLRATNLDLRFQKQALDAHNIVSVTDAQGRITAVNDKFCEKSQYSREELLGQTHRLLKSGRHPPEFYEDMWRTISAGKVWHGELCNRRKDGALYWMSSTILPFLGEDGLPRRYVAVRTDITAIKEAQQALENSQERLEQLVATRTAELAAREQVLRSLTDAAQDAVIMIDASAAVTHWNPAAERMFGYSAAEMLGKDLHMFIVPERYLAQYQAGFAHFVRTGEGPAIGRTLTLRAKHRDGREFPVDISLSAVRLHGAWNAVGIVRDATDRVQTEERLRQLATTDTLTGVRNRRRFDEVLATEIQRAARYSGALSLILFDIDHFKRINDSFGHQTGDQVLVQLAVTVGEAIRSTDLLARWGGEEFAILLPGSDQNAARILAEKLRLRVENQVFPDVSHITCSFGVAEWVPGDRAEDLLRKADDALYRAKANGRNRVEIAPSRAEPA
ncbi:MAG: diguanylate cyclase [Pseudomonadota bacterium]